MRKFKLWLQGVVWLAVLALLVSLLAVVLALVGVSYIVVITVVGVSLVLALISN